MLCKRTCLSSVTTRHLSTRFLVVYEPLEKTTHKSSSLGKRGVLPRRLCLRSPSNFLPNVLLIVRNNGANVKRRCWVKTRDVFPVVSRERGQDLRFF